jgi:hypothetical protein
MSIFSGRKHGRVPEGKDGTRAEAISLWISAFLPEAAPSIIDSFPLKR